MLKMFFNVATITSDDSIHRALTKQEVESIGKTEKVLNSLSVFQKFTKISIWREAKISLALLMFILASSTK